jgi:hypothetical protein
MDQTCKTRLVADLIGRKTKRLFGLAKPRLYGEPGRIGHNALLRRKRQVGTEQKNDLAAWPSHRDQTGTDAQTPQQHVPAFEPEPAPLSVHKQADRLPIFGTCRPSGGVVLVAQLLGRSLLSGCAWWRTVLEDSIPAQAREDKTSALF